MPKSADSGNSLIQKISPRYFWDVDFRKMDMYHSRRLIIERVFSLGEVREMDQVIQFYGEEAVIKTLAAISYLDPKTLNFVSKLFNKPLSEFRCYKKKPSTTRLLT